MIKRRTMPNDRSNHIINLLKRDRLNQQDIQKENVINYYLSILKHLSKKTRLYTSRYKNKQIKENGKYNKGKHEDIWVRYKTCINILLFHEIILINMITV